MLISFLYFEWRLALNCFKRCLDRCSKGKGQNNMVHLDQGSETKGMPGDRRESNENRSKQEDEQLEGDIQYGLDRLLSKKKNNDASYGDHGFDGHDYASNR